MPLLSLPEDTQLLLVRVLANEAGGEAGPSSLAAMAALAASCSALRGVVSTSRAWRLAADTLGLGPRDYHALPMLCHAAAWANRLIRSLPSPGAKEDAASMHVALRPRGGGWMLQLMAQLGPLGLCSVVAGSDVPSTPFVIVACDARQPCAFLDGTDSLSVLGQTAPCGLGGGPRCSAPAALGCLHCLRHGGQGAHTIAAAWAAHVQSGKCCRVLFAAQSPEVRDSFRRAVCAARRGLRRGPGASGVDGTRCVP